MATTAALEYGGGPDVAVFLVAALALAGVAWVVSFSTEAVGERFGPALTGVLQSTLGNLPELFVVLFALSAGELVVAQYSILGSLFANALLVLGLVIVAGARAAGGSMRFGRRLPNDTATLLLLAIFIISLLGALGPGGRPGEQAPGGDLRHRCRRPAGRLRGLARLVPARRGGRRPGHARGSPFGSRSASSR